MPPPYLTPNDRLDLNYARALGVMSALLDEVKTAHKYGDTAGFTRIVNAADALRAEIRACEEAAHARLETAAARRLGGA